MNETRNVQFQRKNGEKRLYLVFMLSKLGVNIKCSLRRIFLIIHLNIVLLQSKIYTIRKVTTRYQILLKY